MTTRKRKSRFLKIKIIEDGKKVINLTIPLFLISAILFFIPKRVLNKWTDDEIDIKEMYHTLKSQGKGARINVNDGEDQVNIEFR